jgi:hypothetical protein
MPLANAKAESILPHRCEDHISGVHAETIDLMFSCPKHLQADQHVGVLAPFLAAGLSLVWSTCHQ